MVGQCHLSGLPSEEKEVEVMGFCVKELFPDIDQSGISFLNKALKLHCSHYNATVGKRTLPGEKWPSNEWPDVVKTLACALLTLHRSGVDPKIILQSQILYPITKEWGIGIPNYNGEWEGDVERRLGFKPGFLEEPEAETPSADDDGFYPALDSPELKKRNRFIDMLDEIK
jgi:hypothetical protein